MIDNNLEIECFIQFLKDNNIYELYISACDNSKHSINIRELLLDIDSDFFVSHNFIWGISSYEVIFWFNVNKKWLSEKDNYFTQYKRNVLIEKLL